MEKVKDLILYQVATDRHYRVGDKYEFNKSTINGQYERIFNSVYKIDQQRLCDFIYKKLEKKWFWKIKKDSLYDIAHMLEGYDVIVKELATEQVRQEMFADHPSRMHCMYLSLDKETALKNIKEFAKLPGREHMSFQVVAVKLNGVIFKAGQVYMSREGESYNYYYDKAKEYWSQKNLQDDEVKEVLFEGTAEIVEILEEINRS